jgi:tetratricopeptide (TPR) repeat protein
VWAKALAYCRQAGEKALARSANREAVGSFEQALNALQHLPAQHDTGVQALDLWLDLHVALLPSGNSERILATLREAEALAEALDDPRRLGQVSVSLSQYFFLSGAYEQSMVYAQRVLALATASENGVLQALASQRLGLAHWAQGDYRRAIDCLRQTMASLEGARRRERFGLVFLPAAFSCALLACCHAELGTFAEGRALGDEGLRIAEAVEHPASLMSAHWGSGVLALRQGALSRALPLLERAIGICQEASLPVWFPRMAMALGASYTLGGRIADAVPLLTQALESTAGAMAVFPALCSLPLSEAQLLAGRLEEAHALAQAALAFARERQERGHEAYALRLLGEIAARRDPPHIEAAETHSCQALALAEALDMRPLQAHCHRDLGTLYAAMGQREQARAALSTALEMYQAMDMTFWLPETEAALGQVEGRDPWGRPVGHPVRHAARW